ncbi:DNA-binding response OmpR family regulator [Paenibacillus rhizosphaerae]|uniref:DNA-binding response OmpR family regulator n=1 Tax=Paenibacillus rhizosphaerae TaxID=297318 RepID=A0A839U0Z0_9BACL|nr:DNA-binding response OmpR family regulator [Paenibacillus rhizosphaerae]
MSREAILLVDDEKEIIELIEIYLKNEGYTLYKASNGLEALEALRSHPIDLIILDVMMPQMDGIQACMKIREKNNTPIIMLSAKSQDIDKISGLSIGADDYVTKPFNPLELVARVKSQLRRYKLLNYRDTTAEDEIVIDDLVINTATHTVTVGEQEVKLTPREFDILKLLAVNQGNAPVEYTMLMVQADHDPIAALPSLPDLNPIESIIRGTFADSTRVSEYDGTVGTEAECLPLTDNTTDPFQQGMDGMQDSVAINSGNYGVLYKIILNHVGRTHSSPSIRAAEGISARRG